VVDVGDLPVAHRKLLSQIPGRGLSASLVFLSMTHEQQQRLTLAATVLGSSLAFVDATVVVVALPTIQHDLHFSLAGEQWVYLSYSLALAALYLPAGAVGDRMGRRETFMAGIAGLALASVVSGAAPDGPPL